MGEDERVNWAPSKRSGRNGEGIDARHTVGAQPGTTKKLSRTHEGTGREFRRREFREAASG